ncbi:hypothetical protein HYX15_01010 [Candidatus Woesearchaeota archaeon]|nr:hypothetical protein [Candidatus Woesearchaeota archaeon]
MKKGVLGEGLMDGFSIITLAIILTVFFVLFANEISYADMKNISEIITSKKVSNDGGLTLKNLMNTPIEDVNLYEFIILNQNDKDKIKEKVREPMNKICKVDSKMLVDNPQEVCLWYLEIKFTDKTIFLNGGYDPIIHSFNTDAIVTTGTEPKILPLVGFDKKFRNSLEYSLSLPDYKKNLVNIKLKLFKGLS